MGVKLRGSSGEGVKKMYSACDEIYNKKCKGEKLCNFTEYTFMTRYKANF